jgi:hypothetical protein
MMDIVALCMTSIMIYHVKTKYTAVGKNNIHNISYSNHPTIVQNRPKRDCHVLSVIFSNYFSRNAISYQHHPDGIHFVSCKI